ncbi:lipid-A-disaccharide synthase [Anthocerotibacter panamensis]|uniref:lipid-A-disaccharide synthase n=1 Tax=Anthocerotibacter panamensis TaxID=2857077 RepID=UPI001C4046F4|nr:lipid-A-disaccharide synthase [Anthocerotibacter panamensis]
MAKRIFMSTGEVSGDLQGSYLVKALLAQNPDLEIVALGGERMAQAGAKLLANTAAIGSIGLVVEALPLVLPTLKIQRLAQQYLQAHPPDLVIYIDYMTPNINLGLYVRKHFKNIPTVFYIAPQEWVWRSNPTNTRRIIGISDLILAIFPVEAEYYKSYGANVEWVGHPLIDIVQPTGSPPDLRREQGVVPEEKVVLLMPASRTQELKYILPDLFRGARMLQERLPGLRFWLPLANPKFKETYIREAQTNNLNITYLPSCDYTALSAADLVVGKSGTVNLETALLKVPQLVLYRLSQATYLFLKYVVRFSIPFASPVNLVTMEPIVPEYLQEGTDAENIARESYDLLTNTARRETMLQGYDRICEHLGSPGVLRRAAAQILKLL